MALDIAIGWPPPPSPAAAAAAESAPAAPGASGVPGPSPALLPATYVDPVSGVVVLQTRGPDDTVNTLPTIRQLDAYQSGAATPPTAHTDIRNSPA